MFSLFEQLAAAIWNRLRGRGGEARRPGRGVNLGFRLLDGRPTNHEVNIGAQTRSMHVAVLGKTGSGKSSLLRHLAEQDIWSDRGFLYFDLHGDAMPFLLSVINARERQERRHLSEKLIIVEPADPHVSVGLNPLEGHGTDFVRIAEFSQVLKDRWHLDSLGARTDELLRNSLFVLAANGLTLLEIAALLTHTGFRAQCLRKVTNAEIRQYFELRYEAQSEPMRATMREPILNKTSAFTADPHFRHIVGQPSTFSLKEAMDEGHWVIVNLDKGRLGEQALTLGSLILTTLKHALFTRSKRSLFTLYCDEIQNLVSFGSGLETILSEARKFQVGIISANQFLDQYPAPMRAAIQSVGTHVFFQLSSSDATHVAQALDGGRPLAERLKNLPQRRAVVKTGAERWAEIVVPTVKTPKVDYSELVTRATFTRGRARVQIEREITKRQAMVHRTANEVLNEWE